MTVWVLGDQLDPSATLLQSDGRVLMIEAHAFDDRLPYHPQKLALVFATMRHFRDDLRERGYEVTYPRTETPGEELDRYSNATPGNDLVVMNPPSHGAGERLRGLVSARGGSLTLVENDLLLTTPADFDDRVDDVNSYRQEHWYRHARRETGILMDGDDPAGGEWDYDDQNRETPPEGWTSPEAPRFEPDETTREVTELVRKRYPDAWGSPEPFVWPVTREATRQAPSHFIEVRLPEFGLYQDVMVDGERALCHSLLSAATNLGLLHPRETVEVVEEAYERSDALLNSAEGLVRQVLGWRGFVRHVYRRSVPELAGANQLDQTEPLPKAYWTGEADMNCLSEAVSHVRDRGYAHHIERLMVLSNFALACGVNPAGLDRWFHLGFVDAFHWVTTPNVVTMGSFATDVFSSKPYVSSGNYVNKMSDYCSPCPYAVSKTTGENACPFNALYWDFLKKNEARLRGTGRMGLMYSHVDRKDDEEWEAIRARADETQRMGRAGTL